MITQALPSIIAKEITTNSFMRAQDPAIQVRTGLWGRGVDIIGILEQDPVKTDFFFRVTDQ